MMPAISPEFLLPDWPAPANVRSLFTTRVGGFSASPFDGFNLGDHVGDDPAAVAQMDTIANTSTLQSTVADMANFWDPCATFGKAIANKQVTAANAAAKTAAWQSSYNK